MLLWLNWFAAFLDEAERFAPFTAQARAAAHRWLDRIEYIFTGLILIHAAPHVRRAGAPRHSSRRVKPGQLRRAAIGFALRHALRPTDLRARIAALSQDIAPLVARLLKRLPCGLTRRRPFLVRPEARTPCARMVVACATVAADTS